MDLLRGQVQRGVFVDLLLVVRLAAGHRFGGQGGARLRHVLADEEGAQLGEGRHHAAADGLAGLLLQLCLLGGRDAGRQLLERRVQRRLGRILQFGDRGDGHLAAIEHRARHAEATLEAGTHVVGLLVEVARHIVQARDVVAVVLRGLHLAPGHEGQVGPERGVRVERHFVGAQAHIGGQVEHLVAVDRVVDAVLGRERLGVDLVQLGQHVVPDLQPALLRGRADIGHAGGVGRAVAVFAGLTATGFAPGPFLLVDGAELRIGGAFGGQAGRGGGRGSWRRGQGGAGRKGQGEQQRSNER